MGGSEQAKCRGVSQAAQEFGERGLSPKNVVRGGDEEGEVWPQKAGRNVDLFFLLHSRASDQALSVIEV